MLRCDLVRLLKEIDNRFRFYPSAGTGLTAGIWLNLECRCTDCLEYNKGHIFICAIPDSYIPEETIVKDNDEIVDRGWRAIFRIVMNKKHMGRKLFQEKQVWTVLHKHGIWNLNPAKKVLPSKEYEYV